MAKFLPIIVLLGTPALLDLVLNGSNSTESLLDMGISSNPWKACITSCMEKEMCGFRGQGWKVFFILMYTITLAVAIAYKRRDKILDDKHT